MNSKIKIDDILPENLVYDFIKWTAAPSACAYFRPKIYYQNKEAIKKLDGAFIISANHINFIDPLYIHCLFPKRRIHTVAMEEMFNKPGKAWFFSHINCIEVDRNNVGIDLVHKVVDKLKKGKVVCIFPEGAIEQEKQLTNFRGGCAMFSLLGNAPIVPVYLIKRPNVLERAEAVIGKPIYPKDVLGESASIMGIEKLNEYIYEQERLLEATYKKIKKGACRK